MYEARAQPLFYSLKRFLVAIVARGFLEFPIGLTQSHNRDVLSLSLECEYPYSHNDLYIWGVNIPTVTMT